MPRFKQPAPPPPTTPSSKLRTPLKSMSRKNSGGSNLSLVAAFDDLMRNSAVFHSGAEKEFLILVKSAKEWQNKWRDAEGERQRLKMLLKEREKELSSRDLKIKQAREMVNLEMKERQRIEQERDNLQKQWGALADLVNDGTSNKINNETLERIRRLNASPMTGNRGVQRTPSAKRNYYNQENMAPLVEQSAESLLDASELSFDDSREDILEQPQKRRSSLKKVSKRRSHSMGNQDFIATATVSLKNGVAEAEACIETPNNLKELVKKKRQSRDLLESKPHKTPTNYPTPGVQRTLSNAGNIQRPHKWQTKKKFGSTTCDHCNQRIKFNKEHYVCSDCGISVHLECKLNVVGSCILRGLTRTPTNKNGNFLADFAPLEPPMIPSLIEVCIEEVNRRGLKEVGIWRVPGSEKDSRELMEKFQNGKGPVPDVSKCEIQTVTSCVTKFLRQLKEPVIPLSLWQVFVDAASIQERIEREAAVYQAISELPQPNRDTLAFLIIHLQNVADNVDKNKMAKSNLAKCMGPTVVGYSSSDPVAMISESGQQELVMLSLLNISEDYWKKLLEPKDNQQLFGYLKTPESMFGPVTAFSPKMTTGGPAKRTRSRQHNAKQQLFQSPMIY